MNRINRQEIFTTNKDLYVNICQSEYKEISYRYVPIFILQSWHLGGTTYGKQT